MGGRALRAVGSAVAVAAIAIAMIALVDTAAAQAPATGPRSATGTVIRVGAKQSIRTVAEASRIAKDGDVIEIDAGTYVRDTAVFSQRSLTIRGVGGRPTLDAGGASAEGKATWVVRGGDIRVENLEFTGARVPDRNGAGIRLEAGRLTVKGCVFRDSENGILTGNARDAELVIEDSEFADNGAGDGRSHNLYVGTIARLTVIGSWLHHARGGHLLKTRAERSYILYNRLTDEPGGRASYELNLPSGGLAYVIGNVIQQEATTENYHVISYGEEFYTWHRNELYLVNNTIVDNRPHGGVFLRVRPGEVRVKAVNNLLVGRGRLESAIAGEYAANFNAEWGDFAMAPGQDYRLKAGSRWIGKAVDPGSVDGVSLRMEREYQHPSRSRPIPGAPSNPGALQSVAP